MGFTLCEKYELRLMADAPVAEFGEAAPEAADAAPGDAPHVGNAEGNAEAAPHTPRSQNTAGQLRI